MIYAQPFKNSTKKCTGPATDSGFASLDDVAALMGEPDIRYKNMLIYGAGEDRIVYSKIIFDVDDPGIKG